MARRIAKADSTRGTPRGQSARTEAAPAAAAADDDAMRRVLERAGTVAVVGASTRWERPSCYAMQYLQAMGYRILPVNPTAEGEEILGRRVLGSLAGIGEPVHLVNVFRRSDAVAETVDEAIAIGARAVWLQEGVRDPDAEARARAAGLDVVADRCIKKEHFRLFGGHRAGDASARAGRPGRLDSGESAA